MALTRHPRPLDDGRPAGVSAKLAALTLLITAALAFWAYAFSRSADTHGLAPIFFTFFTREDFAALVWMMPLTVLASLLAGWFANRCPPHVVLRAIGTHVEWAALAGTLALAWGAWKVYLRFPLSIDEYAAVFQARIFAAGHLSGKFPPALLDWLVPRGFQNDFIDVAHDTGRVTSGYWPSFSLLLTPLTWLGVPWLLNPAISGLTLLAVHRLALRLFRDLEAAGLAVLLTAASPVFFADGISYYSMPAHLLVNTLYAALLLNPTRRSAFAAGVLGSVALTLHNPFPHLLFAPPWIAALYRRPDGLRSSLALAAGYVPLALVLGVGWFWFTAPSNGGFAHLTAPFAWPTRLAVLARLVGIAKLWAWAVPGLLVLAAAGAWASRRGPDRGLAPHDDACSLRDAGCRLLTASALLTLLGYLFVPFDQGHGWGYRYFHSAWMALPVLAAAALTRAPRELSQAPREFSQAPRRLAAPSSIFQNSATRSFIVACALLSLPVGTTLRAVQIRRFIVAHQRQMPAYPGTEARVIILDPRHGFYARDLVQNDPWLRGPVIVMLTRGIQADSEMMLANFPQLRRVYDGPNGSVWSAVKP